MSSIDPLPVASSSRLERADLLIEFLYSEEDPGRVQSYLAELVAGAQGPTAEAARLIHQDVPATFLGENMNALSTAAELGGAAILKFFLAQPGVRPDVPDGCGYTPLFYAARGSHVECIQSLLPTGADPNAGEIHPLKAAMDDKQHDSVVALLADPRTDITSIDVNIEFDGRTLLGYATEYFDVSCMEVLLKNKRIDSRRPRVTQRPQETCLHVAAVAKNLSMLRWLLRETRGRVSVDASNVNDVTALAFAIGRDWADGARALAKEGGADPLRRVYKSDVFPQGMTYLMDAAQEGRLGALKFLLDETPLGRPGAEGVDTLRENGATALWYAVVHARSSECIRSELLRHGADPNLIVNGCWLLHFATREPDQVALRLLLDDPRLILDARSQQDGSTALHFALEFLTPTDDPSDIKPADVPKTVEMLLAAGADPRVEDGQGRTPLAMAMAFEEDGDADVAAAKAASIQLLEAALAEPERVALLHKARRLVDAGYGLPVVVPPYLRDRMAAGEPMPVVEVTAAPTAAVDEGEDEGEDEETNWAKQECPFESVILELESDEERAPREEEWGKGKRHWESVILGWKSKEERAQRKAREVQGAVLALVLGMRSVDDGDTQTAAAAASAVATAQEQGEAKKAPFVFPRELYAELGAMMGVRWADAWRP